MDVAIISNADSPFGLSITQTLVRLGFRVYALGENFEDFDFEHDDCIKVVINPYDLKGPLRAIDQIRDREGAIHSIVLNPRIDRTGHRRLIEIPPEDVLDASVANFTVPLMLTRAVAEDVANLQGFFFFLTWDRPKTGPVDPILDACGEGLRHLSEGVFSVLRVLGARACRIGIQPNASRDIPVSASSDHAQTRIQAEEVADVIEAVVRSKDLNAITEIRIRPRLDRGDLRLPRTHLPIDDFQDLRLPEKENFPPDEILIPTRKPKTYLKIAEIEFPEEEDDWGFDDDVDASFREISESPSEDDHGESEHSTEPRDTRRDRRGERDRTGARRNDEARGGGRQGMESANEETRREEPSSDSSNPVEGEGDARRKKRRRRRRGKKNRDAVAGESGEVVSSSAATVTGNGSGTEPAESVPVEVDREVADQAGVDRSETAEPGPKATTDAAETESPQSVPGSPTAETVDPGGDGDSADRDSTATGSRPAKKTARKTSAKKSTVKKVAAKKAARKTTTRKTARKKASAAVAEESSQVDQAQPVAGNAEPGNDTAADRGED